MSDLKLNVVDKPQVSPSVVQAAYGNKPQGTGTASVEKSGNALPQGVEKAAELSKEQVQEAVSRINEYVQKSERTLDFQLDEDSGKTIIRVYDTNSAELIRQIPSELALELAQKLNDEEPTLLFSAQV